MAFQDIAHRYVKDAHGAFSPPALWPAKCQMNLVPCAITIFQDKRAGSACRAVHVTQKGAFTCAVSSHTSRSYRVRYA